METKLNIVVSAIFWLFALQISWNVSSATKNDALSDSFDPLDIDADLGYPDDIRIPQLYDEDENDVGLDDEENDDDNNWDVLIFTQQWPMTACLSWKEQDKHHTCFLPDKKEFWTIHGIWPSKFNQFGPNFCNKSAHFDVDQLDTIRSQLEEYWPTVHGGEAGHSDELWRHEWLKHGTCASLLQDLSDEMHYFSHGLKWRDSYLISDMLGASNIHPDSNNTVTALNMALMKILRKNPSIHCMYDEKTDISYLLEIRICFDKSLEVIDCDGVKSDDTVIANYPFGKVITNCHISKPIFYPSRLPSVLGRKTIRDYKLPVVNLYKLLQFVMWSTL